MLESFSLNGTWKIRWSDSIRGRQQYAERPQTDMARYIDAQVPGEVHMDLVNSGLIAEPYGGVNCLAARWVEECIWSYRKIFDAPLDAMKTGSRAWLVFDCLDCIAKIVLNGVEIGSHRNTFYPCRVDVTGKLKAAGNILAVHLDSGLFFVSEKADEGYHAAGIENALHKRYWLRKPQCQFGWDWSTRLINVGITGGVRLEYTSDPVRADQLVPLATLSDDLKTGAVEARWFVENFAAEATAATLTLKVVQTQQSASQEIALKPGVQCVSARVLLENPKLWWPVGHGPQNRYTIEAALSIGGEVIARRSARIGFRHVRINQDPHPESGRYFILEINGRKIFAKGGNFVPADMIFQRIDKARYEKLIDLALEANFNMLRIWGGGLYESDNFYELCDEKGILVWQEFIYACARYPHNHQEFHDDAKREAVYQIRRLAGHPSLIVWCGNNELEQGNWHWGYDKGMVHPDYGFFHLTLPRLLAQEDPTRYYQPSSPFSPNYADPLREDVGDQHPWSIGFADTDFRKYRKMISRFPNEGGILGPTALPTMLECLPEGQRYIQSFAWQVHDNSVDSWGEPSYVDNITLQWLGLDARKMSIEEYTYYAGLVQGEGLREYIDNYRCRMFSSSAAIFWMYNDCWPAVRSWTIVDYRLRRTPCFAPVRRALAPISVVIALENGVVSIYGINETAAAVSGDLRYGVFNLAGGMPLDKSAPAALAPNASTLLASFPESSWPQPASQMAFAMLSRDGRLLTRNRLFLPLFKEMKWPKAQVSVEMSSGKAIFRSPAFAWGICLDLQGENPLPDNFFDLYPGVPYELSWTPSRPPAILRVGNPTVSIE